MVNAKSSRRPSPLDATVGAPKSLGMVAVRLASKRQIGGRLCPERATITDVIVYNVGFRTRVISVTPAIKSCVRAMRVRDGSTRLIL